MVAEPKRVMVDMNGKVTILGADTAGMTFPVRCLRCYSGVYDLGAVTVTARYLDCSVWRTPCCDSVVDDRGETGWTNRRDYERLDGGARR